MRHNRISYITNGRFYKSDEISEEEKVFERNDRFGQKTSVTIDNYKTYI